MPDEKPHFEVKLKRLRPVSARNGISACWRFTHIHLASKIAPVGFMFTLFCVNFSIQVFTWFGGLVSYIPLTSRQNDITIHKHEEYIIFISVAHSSFLDIYQTNLLCSF